jgi:hypothetical protein
MGQWIVEYELTLDDAVAYYEWENFERPFARMLLRFYQFFFTVAACIEIVGCAIFLDRVLTAVVTLLCIVLLAYLWWGPSRRYRPKVLNRFRRRIAANTSLRRHLTQYKLELMPTGIRHSTPGGEIVTSWRGYLCVERFGDYLMFRRVADCGTLLRGLKLGFPVPRRAFADEAEFSEFYDVARVYIRRAGG